MVLQSPRPKGGLIRLADVEASQPGRRPGSRPDTIAVSALPVGHEWRADGLDENRVTALAACYSRLPPVLVNRRDRTIVDGAHRVAAARRLGMHAVRVEQFDGTHIEAFAEFIARNSADGLAVTAEDRRRGVVGILATQPAWSDRRIAQLCGVSPKTVARLRGDRAPQPDSVKRVGRDGRTRPVRGAAARARIADALRREPGASLRAIATSLGVSPETVRRVRKHLDAGEAWPPEAQLGADVGTVQALPVPGHELFPRPWRGDNAFDSTASGVEFVTWFEATSVQEATAWAHEVPLSRVYEIADEARRRARFWSDFAESLEGRSRPRR